MKPPAFQFYADDFLAGTMDMTDAEVGLYIRCLCRQWSNGSIPNDPQEIARLSRASTEPQPSLNRVMTKFKVCEDGMLRNERLEKERAKQTAFRKAQSDKGHASAEARFNRASTEPQPSRSPKVNSPSPSPSPNKDKDSEALEIYEAFPLKVGKPKALVAIRKAMEEVPASRLLELTKTFAASRPPGTPFTPHPTTWYNQKRYEDDPATWVPGDLGKTAPPKSSGEFCEGWMNKPASQMTDREALRYVQS